MGVLCEQILQELESQCKKFDKIAIRFLIKAFNGDGKNKIKTKTKQKNKPFIFLLNIQLAISTYFSVLADDGFPL